jgi:hypothetical protein
MKVYEYKTHDWEWSDGPQAADYRPEIQDRVSSFGSQVAFKKAIALLAALIFPFYSTNDRL